MADKKPRTRAKAKGEVINVETGKGVPHVVAQNLKRQSGVAGLNSIVGNKRVGRPSLLQRRSLAGNRRFSKRLSIQGRGAVSQLSALLDLDEYEIPGENDDQDPSAEDAQMDVTALDRYNDDVRRLRKMCIDECRNFPSKGEPDEGVLLKIKAIVRGLCRSTFYGTHKAQVLAEGTVILIVWLLNKKNVTSMFKMHLLQSFAEMIWTSDDLKYALFRCNGSRVLVKLLVKGIMQRSDQARWACYTLVMACVGCREIIDGIQGYPQLEQVVGEIAFHAYWSNWPANFGQILQGILYGPHSVIPVEDHYQFL